MRFPRPMMIALGLAVLIGAPVRATADTASARVLDMPAAVLPFQPVWPPATTDQLLAAIDFSFASARSALSPWPTPALPQAATRDTPTGDDRPQSLRQASRSADLAAPFGLVTVRAPQGLLWVKWRRVEAEIDATAPALARCARNLRYCSAGAARLAAIVKQAARQHGRDRIEQINRSINASIRYRSDLAQWGEDDVWSAPLGVGHRGSFDTGFGDCEDYAIAKYAALRGAGTAAADLRLLIVRDTSAQIDHAVLAVRDGARWLLLDNRWSRLIEENDATFFAPLFALDADGVQRYTTQVAAGAGPKPSGPVRLSATGLDAASRGGALIRRKTAG